MIDETKAAAYRIVFLGCILFWIGLVLLVVLACF